MTQYIVTYDIQKNIPNLDGSKSADWEKEYRTFDFPILTNNQVAVKTFWNLICDDPKYKNILLMERKLNDFNPSTLDVGS